jgi:hypothetical protein
MEPVGHSEWVTQNRLYVKNDHGVEFRDAHPSKTKGEAASFVMVLR